MLASHCCCAFAGMAELWITYRREDRMLPVHSEDGQCEGLRLRERATIRPSRFFYFNKQGIVWADSTNHSKISMGVPCRFITFQKRLT